MMTLNEAKKRLDALWGAKDDPPPITVIEIFCVDHIAGTRELVERHELPADGGWAPTYKKGEEKWTQI